MLYICYSSRPEWVTPCEWTEEVNHTLWFHCQQPHVALNLLSQPVISWVLSVRWRQKFDWGDKTHGWLPRGAITSPVQSEVLLHLAWIVWWKDMMRGFFFIIKMFEERNCFYEANRNPAVRAHPLPAKRIHRKKNMRCIRKPEAWRISYLTLFCVNKKKWLGDSQSRKERTIALYLINCI